MAFLGIGSGKGKARRQEKKAKKYEFKLAKKAQKIAGKIAKKQVKQDGRTERTDRRVTGRENNVRERQYGKTDRTDIRNDRKQAVKEAQYEADEVAYENGMMPIDRTANAIMAGGHAARDLGSLATSLSGAGAFGKLGTILNSAPGKDRHLEFDEDGEVREVDDRPSPFAKGSNMIYIAIAAVLAFVLLLTNKKGRNR